MLTASHVIPHALPPTPLIAASIVVLVGVAVALVLLARRHRAADPSGEGTPGSDETAPLPPGPREEIETDDPRALRLLVDTLERTVEELSAQLATATHDNSTVAATTGPWPPSDPAGSQAPVVPAPADETADPHDPVVSAQLVGDALRAGDERDLVARRDAAMARAGAPRSFERPSLAACVEAELPELGRTPDVGETARVVAQETPVQAPAEDPAPAPEPPAAPAEPERVLPVPAPPAPDPARRRRIFRRGVA